MKYKATLVITLPDSIKPDLMYLEKELELAVQDNFINSEDGETLDSVVIEPA